MSRARGIPWRSPSWRWPGHCRSDRRWERSSRRYKEYGYKPKYITGISAGSILAVPIALGLYDEIKEFVTNFTLDDIFDIKPVNSKGDLTFCAGFRAITGKESFGSQKNLIKTN